MKLLFWNLNGNSLEKYIVDLIVENCIDIAIFTEFEATDFSCVLGNLSEEFIRAYEVEERAKITLYHKTYYRVRVEDEKPNYSIYSIKSETESFIISGVHLPAKPWADEGSRKVVARKILSMITALENDLNHDNSIVIGDFNANPFDEELIQKDAFNAVLFKKIIEDNEYITFQDNEYRRFYNPMLHYISEEKMNYGSYYYNDSSSKSLYWNCYDQVIVRRSLANLIKNVLYCKKINEQNLMNEVMPNKCISDHLPLIVEIAGGK